MHIICGPMSTENLELQWELMTREEGHDVNENGDPVCEDVEETHRAVVPGGWLYRYRTWSVGEDSYFGVTMAFVPGAQ